MIKFSKRQAEELDELYLFFLKTKPGYTGFIEPFHIYKKTFRLQNADWSYVQQLLYIGRELQRTNFVGTLIKGDSLLWIDKALLRDFLNWGGFTKLREDEIKKSRHPVIKWILETLFKTAAGKITLWAGATILYLWLRK